MSEEQDLSKGVKLDQFDDGSADQNISVSKVLIADDAPIQRKYLKSMLLNSGISNDHILIAEDSKQALDLWESHKEEITALILDNNMPSPEAPDLQGVDIIEKIAKETKDSGAALPLMMLHTTDIRSGDIMPRVDNANAIGVQKGEMTEGHMRLVSQNLGLSEPIAPHQEHSFD